VAFIARRRQDEQMAFDQITQGNSGPTGGNTNSPGLTFDEANNLLSTVGKNFTEALLQAALLSLGPQTALTDVTTAQDLISTTLAGALLNRTLRRMRVRGKGIYTSAGTTTPTMTIALVLGGTTVVTITTAALSSTASANMPFKFDFEVVTITTGSAGAIEAHGEVDANISADTPAAAAAVYLDTNDAETTAFNLTPALTLAVTVAASAELTSVQLRDAVIEMLA
jgi:hypothetical protein